MATSSNGATGVVADHLDAEKPHAAFTKLEAAGDNLAVAEDAHGLDETRKNPFMRFIFWFLSFAIPGLGMFCEAYFVFSVGNLKAIWTVEYPACWKTHTECSPKLSDSISYTQVSGIIFGQLVLGFLADRIGRKYGSILTAGTMFVMAILLAGSYGSTVNALFTMFTVVQFFFGIGVGGEYPIASSSANERAEATKSLQNRRGETVVCVFSMQGWGNLINTLIIAMLMAAFHQTGAPYNDHDLEIVWRLSYALGLIPLGFILFWRIWILRESAVWVGKRKALKDIGKMSTGQLYRKYGLLAKHYWHRNAGTAASWFVWDFAFYGNKLFQGTFIKIINPKASLLEVLLWTALNSGVALIGYYFAAFTIDRPWMGRKRMQAMGFLMVGFLFLMCAIFYHQLLEPAHIHAFQFLYYFSSFWGQFGPNATTWLLPAELAPTEVRSMCHGLSAAVGKAGALVAGVVFGLVSDRLKFWISAVCGLVGAIITYTFIPNITGLDLREGDKRWLAILDDAQEAYTGEAVNPKYLSLFERILGYGKLYNPAVAAKTGGDDGDFVLDRRDTGYRTEAETAGGMVVGTRTSVGSPPDVIHEAEHLPPGKDASFQAKKLEYM